VLFGKPLQFRVGSLSAKDNHDGFGLLSEATPVADRDAQNCFDRRLE